MFITIVTPSYNRANELPALYRSLCNQTNKDFLWFVVDDGSTDSTGEYIISLISSAPFAIQYVKKKNGGKHTALNVAVDKVESELFFIVDSDDLLVPDAIETIVRDWKSVRYDNLCGIGYLRGYNKRDVIGDSYPKDYVHDNFINLRYNSGISGDKAEVWVTNVLKQYGGFPECDGEKFVSESVLWIKVSRHHDMLFRNQIIYITEYLPGGLSETGRALRFRCPNLMAYGSLETMTLEFSIKMRFKQALLYIVYSLFGGKSLAQMLQFSVSLHGYRGSSYNYPVFSKRARVENRFIIALCFLPGILLYRFWQYKYRLAT